MVEWRSDLRDDGAPYPHTPERFGRVRLQTLLLLRWLGVAGQTLAVLIVQFGLGLDLPLNWCFGVIAVSAWLNFFLSFATESSRPLSPNAAALQLAFDVIQVSALLGLTGGAANPFIILLIAPVVISATALPLAQTLALGILALFCVTALLDFRLPLPSAPDMDLTPHPLYEQGMAAAVAIAIMFTSAYAWRVAEERRRLSEALAATQAVLSREQRLSALGGLAAAAAHELGTPLGAIYLTAKEMRRGLEPDDPLGEDIALLVSQAERCRDILRKLSAGGEIGDSVTDRAPLQQILEEAAAPLQGLGPEIAVRSLPFEDYDGDAPEPVLARSPEVIYGLGNLIENAVDFAESLVKVTGRWSDEAVLITVSDDGPGFPSDMLSRLGEPYVTSRPRGENGHDGAQGLGLGFFIAKTFLERSGAQVEFGNREGEQSGAVVRMRWPRERLALDEPPALGPLGGPDGQKSEQNA